MADPIHTEEQHDEAEELLPWYATGQLDQADRALVEIHLSSCARCQRQLAVERRLIDEFRALDLGIDSSWARLKAQIAPPRGPSPIGRAVREFWDLLRRPAVATLATAQIAFVAIAATILIPMNRPDFRALGSSEAPPTANLIVIFRADATVQDIKEALNASEASMVGGPTAADAYLLRVPQDRRAAALASLQRDDHVQLAQPIDAAAP